MRQMQRWMQSLLLIPVLVFAAFQAKAQSDPVLIQVLDGATGNFKVDSFVTVQDMKWWTPAERAKIDTTIPVKLRNLVTLKINEESSTYIRSNFTTEVNVRIIYTNKDSLTDSITHLFTINYDTAGGKVYNSQRLFTVNNAYKLTTKILGITTTFPGGTTAWDVTPLLRLENEMQIERYYNFSCASYPSSFFSYLPGADLGNLHVFYGTIDGATEYDFEWTYIDSLALRDTSLYGSFDSPDPARIFAPGATRVTSFGGEHTVPLLYAHGGYVFSRVRAVRVLPDGQRIEGKWSTEKPGSPVWNRYYFAGHERKLNWQSTTSFAEEGKLKSVVQYYDGSLLARQTVTKDNSTDNILVAETLYDYQGRPTIQVMPAPQLSNLIGYIHDFNKALDGSSYEKSLYDSLVSPADYCNTGAPAMNSTSGANKYYSSNFGYTVDGHRAVPKAFGYAFAETRYAQDNTGRIVMQGGVGEQHRLGSGHETRYYYGKPDQKELDVLFGTEAGDASHYQKNMVRDANGQYSVSYVDMHGRTVATALAGKPTAKLDTLESYTERTITKNLSDPSTAVINGISMESSTGLVVTKAGTHLFQYSLQPDSIRMQSCDSSQVCYDCIYNLEISISDECNNQQLPDQTTFVLLDSNFTLGNYDTTCGNTIADIDTVFSIYLLEGSYTISKKLTVNRPGYEYYRDSVFMKKNLCKTFEDFYNEELELLQNQECQPSCASCIDSLGTYEEYRDRYLERNGIPSEQLSQYENQIEQSYQQATQDCNLLCDSIGINDGIRDMMLADMNPESGQYANPDPLDASYEHNIFYKASLGDPYNFQDIGSSWYKDEDGKRDSIYNSNGQLVPPNHHSITLDEFIAQFKPSWAETLLSQHPEYCRLELSETFRLSHIWDQHFEQTETYAEAKAKGYLNPVGLTGYGFLPAVSGGTDPLSTLNTSLYNDLKSKAENYRWNGSSYTSMWGIATATAHCNDGDENCFSVFLALNKGFDSTALCRGELDMAWRSFQQLYLTEKRRILSDYFKLHCPSSEAIPDKYLRHFPDLEATITAVTFTGNEAAVAASANDSLNNLYGSNCADYAQQWYHQLATCNFSSADSAIIMYRLIQVCKEGSDNSHPFGSSTIRPGSSYQYASFDEVIETYMDSVSRDYDENCNGYLITAPKPYERPAPYASKPVWTRPDSCECERITGLHQQFLVSGGGDAGFAAYLKRVVNVTMTDSELQQLLQLCSGEISCKFIESPINLPVALQCVPTPACLNCDSVSALHERFITRFGITPEYENNDSLQRRRNLLYSNYMNFHTGFGKTSGEYLQFLDTCAAYNPASSTCDSLKQLLQDFRNEYYFTPSNTPAYNADGCDTTTISFGQNLAQDNGYLKYRHLFSDGIVHIPDSVYSHLAGSEWLDSALLKQFSTGVGFGLCNLNNKFTWEMRVKDKEFTGAVGYPDGLYLTVDVYGGVGSSIRIHHDYPGTIHVTDPDTSTTQLQEKFADWKTITIKVENNRYKVYINGEFRYEKVYAGFIDRLNGLDVFFNATEGYIDYQRVYSGDGELILAEEYDNACEGFAVVNPAFDCSKLPCDSAFTLYYNAHRGTSYNSAQVQQQYITHCGRAAKPCQPFDDEPTLCTDGELFTEIVLADEGPCSDTATLAYALATEKYNAYKDSLNAAFENQYLAKCMQAYQYENFTVNAPVSEFHYTLYYYDQAGNLLKTVPPQGVDLSKYNWLDDWSDSVKTAKTNSQLLTPAHQLKTDYRYNTLNQVVAQHSPDGGESKFWYDRLGRLALSQNAKQKAVHASKQDYSYTRYDILGRIMEVGEINNDNTTTVNDAFTKDAGAFGDWLTDNEDYRRQITSTYYDMPYAGFAGLTWPLVAKNLRNRVAFTTITTGNNPSLYSQGSFYSYDIHGNVDTLLQDYRSGAMSTADQRFKKIVYKYDLISGKVNHVAYQAGETDQAYHRYSYDAENRLTKAEISLDSLIWEKDATYRYLKHGPLSRTVLGQQKVQGIDYGYTLQGWLKVINGVGPPVNDIANDGYVDGSGTPGGFDTKVARDAYGIALFYFAADYSPVYGVPYAPDPSSIMDTLYRSLYNGNITAMSTHIPAINYPINTASGAFAPVMMYNYRYDQLNRIKRMDAYCGYNNVGQHWGNSLMNNKLSDYRERISYDANGNILKYFRNGTIQNSLPLGMDSLSYNYYAGTNKLRQVRDSVPGSNYTEDIDNQSDTSNYVYDAIGNLIRDKAEGIDSIRWTVYGKIRDIYKQSGTIIRYEYDGGGNRISKTVKNGSDSTTTWYVRDATGNVMSVYRLKPDTVEQQEMHVYGSKRLGIIKPERLLTLEAHYGDTSGTVSLLGTWRGKVFRRGQKFFELSNHLGNVLVTITDRKQQIPKNDTLLKYYEPDVITANDYYPFGMLQPGRNYNASNSLDYRYGFNGKENDNDVKGEGSLQDYGMRVYDPRLGRFLSVDPITNEYPELTPYQFSSNSPIENIDVDGLEAYSYNGTYIVHDNIPRVSSVGVIDLNSRKAATSVTPAPVKATQLATARYIRQPTPRRVTNLRAAPDRLQAAAESAQWQNEREAIREENKKPAVIAQKLGNLAKDIVEEPFREYEEMTSSFNKGEIFEGLIHGKNALVSGGTLVGGAGILKFGKLGNIAAKGSTSFVEGSFSVFNWKGYPGGGIKPTGPFRLLEGAEYTSARNLANSTNAAMRKTNPEMFKGLQIHELHPVKFGGSPTDLSNKIFLTPSQHAQYTNFWNALMRSIK